MKTSLFIVLIIFQANVLMASHIVGGEMYYDCLGNDNYRVTIKLYRDCNSDGAQFDSPLNLGVFINSNNSFLRNESVSYPGSALLPIEFSNPCVTPPSSICVEEAIYTKVINLPPSQEGYTIAYQRCCRGPSIMNINNPADAGLTLIAEIPGVNTGVSCNSSPRFSNYPPLLVCNNLDLDFDHSATDPDGDSLAYSLCTPFSGGTSANPAPIPPSNPPYNIVTWASGFSSTQPFGVNAPININPVTGQLTASPDLIGKFVVGVCVNEYRNGILIGTTRRDFIFTVFNCDVSLEAVIVPQEELASFNSYCDGLEINFENESNGGSNYQWDFGVPSDSNANSTQFQPVYTFPSEGSYEVTLILNPGWSCSDTSKKTFEVYDSLHVNFDPPNPQCITGNSFDFVGTGDYQSGATFNWGFGTNATPANSTTETVDNIVFDTSGYHEVTYLVNWEQCENSITDSIFIFREPTIDFGVDTGLYCAPYIAEFTDSSNADAPITYQWDFGNGTSSTEENPIVEYDTPGIYDVTLDIEVMQGCPANLTLTKPGLIEVYPSPTADFTVSPSQTTVFDTEITISDQSIDSDELFYQLNPTADTTERNLTFHFLEGGYHYPYQVVTNEFGCKDTATRTIYVEPQTTLYVPNAFTPDEDDINEVFKPVVLDVSNYYLIILNRWGDPVFETENPNEGWDGTHNGIKSPDGVYLWRIRFQNSDHINEVHRGHVSLLR